MAPDRNRCWFAGHVLRLKRACRRTVDRREAAALERILRNGASTAMEPVRYMRDRDGDDDFTHSISPVAHPQVLP